MWMGKEIRKPDKEIKTDTEAVVVLVYRVIWDFRFNSYSCSAVSGVSMEEAKLVLKPGIYLYPFRGEEVTLLNTAWTMSGYNQDRIVTYRSHKDNVVYTRNIYEFNDMYEYMRPEEPSALLEALKDMPQACKYAAAFAENEGRNMNAYFWGVKAQKVEDILKELGI